MAKQLNTILRLRRDNDYNYRKIASTFIPADGEICLVDTSSGGGLRAVCGDGKTPFGELSYNDTKVIKGIYKDGAFYNKDNEIIPALLTDIYIDISNGGLYYYNGIEYKIISSLPAANAETAGIMKLYDSLGYNTDGTMTQKAITEELNQKVEVYVDEESEETLIFSYDIFN